MGYFTSSVQFFSLISQEKLCHHSQAFMHPSPNRRRQLPLRNAQLPLSVSCLTAREWHRNI